MILTAVSALLLVQATPAPTPTPTPTPPPAAATTPVEDLRFCIASLEIGAAAMREQGGEGAMRAAFIEGALPSFQQERTRLGDSDDAALEAERARLRVAFAAGGMEGMQGEQQRFMNACLPRMRAAMGGGR